MEDLKTLNRDTILIRYKGLNRSFKPSKLHCIEMSKSLVISSTQFRNEMKLFPTIQWMNFVEDVNTYLMTHFWLNGGK